MYFSVSTPSVFREYKLPDLESEWTNADERKFSELEDLAERYETHIHRSTYRLG